MNLSQFQVLYVSFSTNSLYIEPDSSVLKTQYVFSYNMAPKHKLTSSSGFQMELAICFIAGRKAGSVELTEKLISHMETFQGNFDYMQFSS